MKKWLIILIMSVFVLVNLCPCFAVGDILKAEPDRDKMKNDETLAIKVKMTESQEIYGIQFVMTYDFGKFTVSGIEQGDSMLDAVAVKTDYNEPGKVKIAFVYSNAINVYGNICTIDFQSRSSTGLGDAYFNLQKIELTDAEGNLIELEDQKYSVNIYSDIPEETPLPTQPPAPKITSEPKSTNAPVSADVVSTGGSGTGKKNNSLKTEKPVSDATNTEYKQEITATEIPFLDINGHWAYEDIAYMYKKGIINGVSKTEFMPDANVNRAEFVKMISEIANLPEEDGIGFSDVKENDWFFDAVQRASAAELVNGYGEEFRPQNIITREEMAVIADRCTDYLGITEEALNQISFDDEDVFSQWSSASIYKMTRLGVFNGMDGKFYPLLCTTRAEAISVIKRIYLLIT